MSATVWLNSRSKSSRRKVCLWLYLLLFTLRAHHFASWSPSGGNPGAFDFSFSNKEAFYVCWTRAAPPVSAENIQLNTFNTKTIGSAAKCVVFITNQTRQILGDMGGSVKVLWCPWEAFCFHLKRADADMVQIEEKSYHQIGPESPSCNL